MGQQEVYSFLKKQKEPMLASEIAEKMNESKKLIHKNLKRLIEIGDILYKEIDRNEAMALTSHLGKKKIKQRVRLYYICSD